MKVVSCRQLAAAVKCQRAIQFHHHFPPGLIQNRLNSRLSKRHRAEEEPQSTAARASSNATPPDLSSTTPSTSGSSSSIFPKKRIAVFVSGGGSNFRAIHAAILEGVFDAEVAAVITNAPSCGGAVYARQHNIPVLVYPSPKSTPSSGLGADELTEALKNTYRADFLILAGYMKLIPADLVRAFPRAILNIHPGLLPSFGGQGMYGSRVHDAVIRSGARFSGPTVHFVDEEYDTGPILAQAVVPVLPTDSVEALAARVLREEHSLYPNCVGALCEGRVTWTDRGLPILWSAH